MTQASKRILVTGASGFIGRPLVADLRRAGYTIRATQHLTRIEDIADTATVDFTGDVDWKPVLRDVDVVIHLAGLAHADSPHIPRSTFDLINWIGTQKLIWAAKESRIDRFIFISTVRAQTDASSPRIVREDDAPEPTDYYGRSKLAAEIAIRQSGVPATILRPVVVYGPHPKGNIKTVVRLAASRLPLPVLGLNSRRSLLGIDNLISAIHFVMDNPATAGETFLIADPKPVTLPELFKFTRAALGHQARLLYLPPTLLRLVLTLSRRVHLWQRISEELVVDTGKLRSFGWQPPIDTYNGILAMLRYERTELKPSDLKSESSMS